MFTLIATEGRPLIKNTALQQQKLEKLPERCHLSFGQISHF